MRAYKEMEPLDGQDVVTFLEQWEREPRPSSGWYGLPSRSLDLVPPPTMEELRSVESGLSKVAATVRYLTRAVASARDCGRPEGFVHPSAPSGT